MRQLSHKVSIVPVIAKSDCLTQAEIGALKTKILQEIRENDIKIYNLPECDRYIFSNQKIFNFISVSSSIIFNFFVPFKHSNFQTLSIFGRAYSFLFHFLSDEDEDFKQQVQDLRESMPFAVVGANAMVDVRGKKIRGRLYPWGVIEVENPAHCDFVKLRTMLITHMQDMQEVTHDVHYENYRSQKLARQTGSVAPKKVAPQATMLDDKDKQLQEKEAELRRMQEMVAQMQRQIKQQSQTSLASVSTTN